LRKVDAGLRSIGLSSLADEGLKVLNRAAEDAVKRPYICGCGNKMSFADARGILMGNESSATNYLQNSTSTALYGKFNPVIKKFIYESRC
jgi:hypothetical protein